MAALSSSPRVRKSFKADTTWFHIFNQMVKGGDCRRLGPYAMTVYLVIKAHTNFNSGRSWPEIDTIVHLSGISRRQVIKSLKPLEAAGYIKKERAGRKNIYRLREKVQIIDGEGRPNAVATWDYLPKAVEETRAHLKQFLLSGHLPDGSGLVLIEKLSLNLQIVNGGEAMQINPWGEGSTSPC